MSLTPENVSVAESVQESVLLEFGQCTIMRKRSICIKSCELRHSYCDEKQKITKTHKRLTVISAGSIIMQVRTKRSIVIQIAEVSPAALQSTSST